MNTKWEEELVKYTDSTEHSHQCTSHGEGQFCCLEKKWIEAFIKDQITKAEKRGHQEGLQSYWDYKHETGSPDMPEKHIHHCDCLPFDPKHDGACERLSEEPKFISRIDPDGKRRIYNLEGKAISEGTESLAITKAQQEIAEQIIEDINIECDCRDCRTKEATIKAQLKSKYLL